MLTITSTESINCIWFIVYSLVYARSVTKCYFRTISCLYLRVYLKRIIMLLKFELHMLFICFAFEVFSLTNTLDLHFKNTKFHVIFHLLDCYSLHELLFINNLIVVHISS